MSNTRVQIFDSIVSIYYPQALASAGIEFKGCDVLDFGCGDGLSSYGICKSQSPKSVTGVEINSDCLIGEQLFAEGLLGDKYDVLPNFKKITPFASLGSSCFDICVAWSVIDCIDRRFFARQMRLIFEALRPGGVCVFQVANLYYSAEGHHLHGLIPDWSHLYMMDSELQTVVRAACNGDEARYSGLMDMYEALNRFCESDFDAHFCTAGFEIVSKVQVTRTQGCPDRLRRIYSEEVINSEQVVWTLRKLAE